MKMKSVADKSLIIEDSWVMTFEVNNKKIIRAILIFFMPTTRE